MGVPSLNDLAVDGTLNTTNQPFIEEMFSKKVLFKILITLETQLREQLHILIVPQYNEFAFQV